MHFAPNRAGRLYLPLRRSLGAFLNAPRGFVAVAAQPETEGENIFTVLDNPVGFCAELPSMYNSHDATDSTKTIMTYEYSEFATILLHTMPHKWQTQYDLGHKAPLDIKYLQNTLEKIEVAFLLGGANGSSKNVTRVEKCHL